MKRLRLSFILSLVLLFAASCSKAPELPFFVRGAALMDNTTLWDSTKPDPDINSLSDRDYAFTSIGGINTVRLSLKMDYFMDESGSPKNSGFAFVEKQLSLAKRHGLRVTLDMHIPNGGATQDYRITHDNQRFWNDARLQEIFVLGWRLIAEKFKGDDALFAYELMNEASTSPENYWKLIRRTMDAVRRVDPDHWIIIEPDIDGNMNELGVKKLIASVHFYSPHLFTHQNLSWDKTFAVDHQVEYPGVASDGDGSLKYYDKAALAKYFKQFSRLSRRLRVPVIVGEFGVSTSASEDSIGNWIKDVIDLVHEHGLAGYLYWQQIDSGTEDLRQPDKSTMAIINKGGYFSPAQFFGIRPGFKRANPGFDAKSYYLNLE